MRFESTADEDFDPEELTKLQKEEGEEIELIREVSNIINVLFNFFGESFLPFFDQLLPYFARMLVSASASPLLQPSPSFHKSGEAIID